MLQGGQWGKEGAEETPQWHQVVLHMSYPLAETVVSRRLLAGQQMEWI